MAGSENDPYGGLTAEHRRLLYLVHALTRSGREGEVTWVKDLPLKALLYEGIVRKVFEWDYAPQSTMFHGRRRFVNVSQEGEDDLNDLRELALMEKLRLSTSTHTHVNAYRLSDLGRRLVERVPAEDRGPVDSLLACPGCGARRQVVVDDEGSRFECPGCRALSPIGLLDIEDVPYVTEPYLPRVAAEGGAGRGD